MGEEDCLQYLNKLDVVEYEDITTGFSINLHSDDNPYFENEVITKEFPMTVNRQPGKKSTTTPILWKEGFDLAAKAAQLIAARAAKGDKDKKESPETRTFFSWFCASGDPVEDDIAELALMATALVVMQQSSAQMHMLGSFRNKITELVKDKYPSTLTKVGAIIAAGIMD